MSLIQRVGWVWDSEKYVTKSYVTNWEGRVGLDPNMYDVTLFSLFFFEGFSNVLLQISKNLCDLTRFSDDNFN